VSINLDAARSLNRELAHERESLGDFAAAVGLPTPKHPSLRGRLSFAVMQAIGGLLWWYSRRIQEAFAALTRSLRSQGRSQTLLNEIVIGGQAGLSAEVRSLSEQLRDVRRELEALRERAEAASTDLQSEIRRLNARLAPAATDRIAALYVAFENAFRGPREEIRRRQSFYLPFIHAREHLRRLPAIDIGCGRGEWLDLLREQGIEGRGADVNPGMLEACRALGLQVVESDGLDYLRSLPDASAGVITAFHVVEHLPFETVLELIGESLRVLVPGGILILETPNPANITVGAHHFYMDPTHRQPLPSDMLRFFVEASGFADVQAFALHPDAEALRVPGPSPLAERFNDIFYGPRDYAVLGYKPEGR
jgi:SAM-dependent methyltransferase